jgi:hypothetical protein
MAAGRILCTPCRVDISDHGCSSSQCGEALVPNIIRRPREACMSRVETIARNCSRHVSRIEYSAG